MKRGDGGILFPPELFTTLWFEGRIFRDGDWSELVGVSTPVPTALAAVDGIELMSGIPFERLEVLLPYALLVLYSKKRSREFPNIYCLSVNKRCYSYEFVKSDLQSYMRTIDHRHFAKGGAFWRERETEGR